MVLARLLGTVLSTIYFYTFSTNNSMDSQNDMTQSPVVNKNDISIGVSVLVLFLFQFHDLI
ncbi:hypothetical protein MASR2M69_05880 [Bacteroidota bacterium]